MRIGSSYSQVAASLIGDRMNMNISIAPLLALIAGIVILIVPRLLNYIVAFYLIAVGVLGLFGNGNMHFR